MAALPFASTEEDLIFSEADRKERQSLQGKSAHCTMSRIGGSDSMAFVTRHDVERLYLFLRSTSDLEGSEKRMVDTLKDKLRGAIQLPPQAIPDNVITIDSRFRLIDQSTKEVFTFTLVMLEQAGIPEGRLSILSALGACVYGHVSGDKVELCTSGGMQRLAIGKILYQPEACGLDMV